MEGSESRALICHYDVDYDALFRRHVAIGELHKRRAFDLQNDLVAGGEQDERSWERVAMRVGAWWTRIVDSDVDYHLLQGLEAIEESQHDAERLRDHVMREREGGEQGVDPFHAYVTARWWDGAGKVHYRCGDMTSARQFFGTACAVARRHDLWFCYPDLASNHIRADFEERDRLGTPAGSREQAGGLQGQYEQLLQQATEVGGAKGIDFDELYRRGQQQVEQLVEAGRDAGPIDVDPALRTATTEAGARQRELLRGVASILHNLSIVVGKRRPSSPSIQDQSMRASKKSGALAFLLGDVYRLAQALQHQARLLAKGGAREQDKALRLAQMIRLDLGWRRGAWIATQLWAQLAAENNSADVDDARDALGRVLAAIEALRKRRGGHLGVDIDLFRHTVAAYETTLRAGDRKLSLHDAQELSGLRIDAARAVRGVVKIAMYKDAFARLVYPTYLQEIDRVAGERRGDNADLHLLELVEEAASRELLDIMEVARLDSAPAPAEVVPARPSADAPVVHPRQAVRGPARREAGSRSAGSTSDQIARDRVEFERRALERPVMSTPHNPEIGNDLRRFAAGHPGTMIIRYFLRGADDKGRPRALHAAMFVGGQPMALVELMAYPQLVALVNALTGRCPSLAQAATLWTCLLDPVWTLHGHRQALAAKGNEGPAPGLQHLVLIPCAEMLGLPLHAALVPNGVSGIEGAAGLPLGAAVPLSFSVSGTAFVNRGRHLLRKQPMDPHDDLCALVPGQDQAAVYPAELVDLGWDDPAHLHLAGARPHGLKPQEFTWWGPGDRRGLEALIVQEPEIFLFSGHGTALQEGGWRDDEAALRDGRRHCEVALQLDGGVLSQYAIATRYRLPRNKWTLLGACVSGQGAGAGGGEVAGFLRSFMAAGAGAIGATLWKVDDARIGHVLNRLLRRAAAARQGHGVVDIVSSVYEIQRAMAETATAGSAADGVRDFMDPDSPPHPRAPVIEACPLVVYL